MYGSACNGEVNEGFVYGEGTGSEGSIVGGDMSGVFCLGEWVGVFSSSGILP